MLPLTNSDSSGSPSLVVPINVTLRPGHTTKTADFLPWCRRVYVVVHDHHDGWRPTTVMVECSLDVASDATVHAVPWPRQCRIGHRAVPARAAGRRQIGKMKIVLLTTKATVTRAIVDGARRTLGLEEPVDVISWAPVDLGTSVRTHVVVGLPQLRGHGRTTRGIGSLIVTTQRKIAGARRRLQRGRPIGGVSRHAAGRPGWVLHRRTRHNPQARAVLRRTDIAGAGGGGRGTGLNLGAAPGRRSWLASASPPLRSPSRDIQSTVDPPGTMTTSNDSRRAPATVDTVPSLRRCRRRAIHAPG
jgi:hypothetical protein